MQVPQGSTPRTLVVHLRGSLARCIKAGDSVTVAGIFLPEPYSGPHAALRASLLTSTYLQAMQVKQNKISYQVRAAWRGSVSACVCVRWGERVGACRPPGLLLFLLLVVVQHWG